MMRSVWFTSIINSGSRRPASTRTQIRKGFAEFTGWFQAVSANLTRRGYPNVARRLNPNVPKSPRKIFCSAAKKKLDFLKIIRLT